MTRSWREVISVLLLAASYVAFVALGSVLDLTPYGRLPDLLPMALFVLVPTGLLVASWMAGVAGRVACLPVVLIELYGYLLYWQDIDQFVLEKLGRLGS